MANKKRYEKTTSSLLVLILHPIAFINYYNNTTRVLSIQLTSEKKGRGERRRTEKFEIDERIIWEVGAFPVNWKVVSLEEIFPTRFEWFIYFFFFFNKRPVNVRHFSSFCLEYLDDRRALYERPSRHWKREKEKDRSWTLLIIHGQTLWTALKALSGRRWWTTSCFKDL